MAFIFVCGTHTFTSRLKGYENVTARCQNCGNFSARCFKRWEWFTFCFIPVIPFSFKPWQEVGCHICNFYQDLKYRPDVQNQANAAGNQIPMQGYGAQAGGGPGPGGPGPGPGPGAQQYPQQQQYVPPGGKAQYG